MVQLLRCLGGRHHGKVQTWRHGCVHRTPLTGALQSGLRDAQRGVRSAWHFELRGMTNTTPQRAGASCLPRQIAMCRTATMHPVRVMPGHPVWRHIPHLCASFQALHAVETQRKQLSCLRSPATQFWHALRCRIPQPALHRRPLLPQLLTRRRIPPLPRRLLTRCSGCRCCRPVPVLGQLLEVQGRQRPASLGRIWAAARTCARAIAAGRSRLLLLSLHLLGQLHNRCKAIPGLCAQQCPACSGRRRCLACLVRCCCLSLLLLQALASLRLHLLCVLLRPNRGLQKKKAGQHTRREAQ